MELVTIVILSLLLVPLVAVTSGALRITLGLAFVLFFPGYTLIAALFPRKGQLGGIERVALSFGLSIAVVPLLGLALNYTPWGIRLYPVLISVLLFVVIMAGVAWYRRQGLPAEERFQVQLRPLLSSLSGSWVTGRWDRLLTILLLVAIVGAAGTLAYVVAKPKVGERFTEFYILGMEGKAGNYPRQIVLGEEGRVIVGIANREHENTEYRIEIVIDGEKVAEAGPVRLDHEEKWEREVAFTPRQPGANQKVQFLLYKGVSSEPYLPLHLGIDVGEAP